MASYLSIDIAKASTFITLATRHTFHHPLRKPQFSLTPFHRKPYHSTTNSLSFNLRHRFSPLSLSSKSPEFRRNLRSFSVAASSSTAASAEFTEEDDVVTKIPPDNRIPATIITGFLGSGKTTLLNHILTADHGKRIAVIENEYGEVDIDGSLVAAKSIGAEDIIMLNNGCLCCTVRGDLVRMIGELVDKKRGNFDHIVIETTGLANPAPIIQTFYAEDVIFNDVKLDGVVTLVDAKHATLHLDEVKPDGVVNEAIEQIAYADRIIVNKTDLVNEPDIDSLIQRIRKINRMANLKRTQFGNVDLDYVLGIGGFDLESIVCEGSLDLDKVRFVGLATISHYADVLLCCDFINAVQANMWLGTLLLERSEDIYRMKGLLSVEGMDERFVFQGVHDIFQGSPDRPWGPDEPRINKIVFIGKNLDGQELEKGFKTCLL
uniref:CobW C-terminal domain-containing protein n=1 Tax=Chenopodium quinoa TaxID=63459 RepID=A0A803LE76_CHEQI